MKRIKDFLNIFIGIILISIAIEYFFAPNDIAAGGVTGLAIIIKKIFSEWNISIITFVLNILLFVISLILVGKEFSQKTIIASTSLSLVMWVIEKKFNPVILTDDILLSTVLGGVISDRKSVV